MEIINPSGGSEFETQPGRGNKNQERPWIGDLPGQGSEGPTDIPNKDDSCPTCGETFRGPHPSRGLGLGVNPNNPVAEPQNPLSSPGQYRGPQQGRGGHFDSGHQKWQDNIARGQELLNYLAPRDFLPGHGGAEA